MQLTTSSIFAVLLACGCTTTRSNRATIALPPGAETMWVESLGLE